MINGFDQVNDFEGDRLSEYLFNSYRSFFDRVGVRFFMLDSNLKVLGKQRLLLGNCIAPSARPCWLVHMRLAICLAGLVSPGIAHMSTVI